MNILYLGLQAESFFHLLICSLVSREFVLIIKTNPAFFVPAKSLNKWKKKRKKKKNYSLVQVLDVTWQTWTMELNRN